MEKFGSADVLKVMQSLVLPMELKINSLVDLVRNLEAKIDMLISPNMERKNTLDADKMVSHNDDCIQRSKSEKPLTSSTLQQPMQQVQKSGQIMTRRRRARAEASNDEVRPKATVTDDATVTTESASHVSSAPHSRPTSVRTRTDTAAPSTSTLRNEDATNINKENEQWTTVRRRKQPRPVIHGTGEVDTALTAIEKNRMIHLWSLRSDTTSENVKLYMLKKKPVETPYEVQKLTLKHDNYASFVVAVPESLFAFFMSAENWPPNTRLNEWFRKQVNYRK